MDKADLSAIVSDVDNCIFGYENAIRNAISKSPAKQVEYYAISLHTSPVHQAIFTLNIMDSASMTQEEVYNEHAQHIPEAEIEEKEIVKKKDLEEQFYFNWDCETIDSDNEYYSLVKPNYGKETTLKGPSLMKPGKVTVESNIFGSINNYYAKNFDLNKSAEDCFNCDLSFKTENTYPGIEFAWEFDKLLKQLEDFLDLVKTNLDPTMIYNQLCNFKMFVGKNFMCPTNMLNLNLMLPALFMKYSIDLGKLSFDLNWILGGIIKATFATIAAFLENLKSLIMPFLNCYIDGINATFGYIKSVVRAVSKGIDSTADTLERVAGAITKTVAQIADLFNTTDSEKLEEEIKKKEAQINKLEDRYKKLKAALSRDRKRITSKKYDLAAIEQRLLDLKRILSEREAVNYVLQKESELLAERQVSVLDYTDFEAILNQYFKEKGKEYLPAENKQELNANILGLLQILKEQQGKTIRTNDYLKYIEKRTSNYLELNERIRTEETRINEDIKTAKADIEKKAESIFEKVSVGDTFVNSTGFFTEENNGGFTKLMPTPRYRTGSVLQSTGTTLNKYALGPWQKVESFLANRYGVQTSNQYMKTEYLDTFRKKTKQYENKAIEGIDYVRKLLLRPAEDLKAFVNDFIGNVINALKNLNLLFEQGAMAEIKLLGELLQLVHLGRLLLVILKMVEEGLGGCEQIEKDRNQQEQLKEIIENIDPDLGVEITEESSLGEDSGDSNNPRSEKAMARVYARNSSYAHLLDTKDCSELSKHIEKENPNLDIIYKNLKEALI